MRGSTSAREALGKHHLDADLVNPRHFADSADGRVRTDQRLERADSSSAPGAAGVVADLAGAGRRERVEQLLRIGLGDERDDLVQRWSRQWVNWTGIDQPERSGKSVGHSRIRVVGVGVRDVQSDAGSDQPVHGSSLRGRRRDRRCAVQEQRMMRDEQVRTQGQRLVDHDLDRDRLRTAPC